MASYPVEGRSVPKETSSLGVSTSMPKVENICFKWKIDNLSFHVMDSKSDYRLTSPHFFGKNYPYMRWRMELYPNKYCHNDEIFMTLKLTLSLEADFSDLRAKCKFFVKDKRKILAFEKCLNIVLEDSDEREGSEKNETETAGKERKWEVPQFISHRDIFLEADRFLPNDVLTIFCEMDVLPGIKDGSQQKIMELERAQTDSKEDCLKDFQTLLRSGTFSDVTLECDGKTFSAHKAILSARSPVFRAMFSSDMKENRDNVVKLEGVKREVFYSFLSYLYSGQVERPERNPCELLPAAEKYLIAPLKREMEAALISQTTVDNAIEMTLFAEKYNCEKLAEHAFDIVKANINLIDDSEARNLITMRKALKSCRQLRCRFHKPKCTVG